jgi:hypothetical protein
MLKTAMCLFSIFIFAGSAHAVIKCEPDGRGGLCCWDTKTDGVFRPISC